MIVAQHIGGARLGCRHDGIGGAEIDADRGVAMPLMGQRGLSRLVDLQQHRGQANVRRRMRTSSANLTR